MSTSGRKDYKKAVCKGINVVHLTNFGENTKQKLKISPNISNYKTSL